MGLLGRAITDWVGIGNLRKFQVRFTKQTWPGETLSSKIVVTSKHKDDGDNLVDLEVALANQDGEVKVSGAAVAALPSR
jgi:acyl dehydratase